MTNFTLTGLLLSLLLYPNLSCVSIRPKKEANVDVHSEIVTIDSIAKIMPYLEKIDGGKDTLAIWDIDDTVMMPTPEFNFRAPSRRKWVVESEKRLSRERRDYLISKIYLKRSVQLVEPKTLDVLMAVKAKNIPSIALTSMHTGKFGSIEDTQAWRISELASVGIDFSELSPYRQNLTFPELQTDRGIPLFTSGIIFTAQVDKAIVFDAVRKILRLRPKTIIFIDDYPEYVTNMEKLCRELKINFYGFVYTAGRERTVRQDEELDQKRFEYLENYGEWPPF